MGWIKALEEEMKRTEEWEKSRRKNIEFQKNKAQTMLSICGQAALTYAVSSLTCDRSTQVVAKGLSKRMQVVQVR